jgi:hypothetical protein
VDFLAGAAGYGFVHRLGGVAVGTYASASGGWLGTRSPHPLYLFTGNSANPQVTLTTGGSLGIGTTSPTAPVHLDAAASGYGFLHQYGLISIGTYIDNTAGWFGTQSHNPLYFFTNNGGARMTIGTDGTVGIGTVSPVSLLQVRGGSVTIGDYSDTKLDPGLLVYGGIQSNGLPPVGNGPSSLCWDFAVTHNIGVCSSSIRYKEHVADLGLGLDAVAALRPVTYDWKQSGIPDLGFIAEEVDRVTPLLVTRDREGVIQGVKYERITAVLVKAMQEQQRRIEELEKSVRDLLRSVGGNDRVTP